MRITNGMRWFCVLEAAALACLAFGDTLLLAEGFSTKTAPSLTAAQVSRMGCRYFTELLGVHSQKASEKQFDLLKDTEVDTVVCCPMGWRFYNFPSKVDLTWKEPDKHPRDIALFGSWKRMVENLAAGGNPLRDALEAARKMNKRFVVSFRMNDNHYVHLEEFPTHNNFWRDHPEYRLGTDPKPYSRSDSARLFNYRIPQVRDFYFSVLEEICTDYDVDGVELDFQRAPRFFHDAEIEEGRAVMTAHVERIRQMLDKAGKTRNKRLELGVRVLPTVAENYETGLDVMAWDAAGWLDGITVSSSYIHTADTGIEGFIDAGAVNDRSSPRIPAETAEIRGARGRSTVIDNAGRNNAARKRAKIYGELNYVNLQVKGTGHSAEDRRYLTPETYRAATLSYLERGADGVSFFNTYCIPQPKLKKLMVDLLANYKDLDALRRSDKNYTCYAGRTMFGNIFPARDEKAFAMFIADEMPGCCKKAVLRFETKASCKDARVEAWVNGTKLTPHASATTELFPPIMVNKASPKAENVKFFVVPVSALKFGVNQIKVKNADGPKRPCDFASAELALYMQ